MKPTQATPREREKLGFRNIANLGIVSLFTDISTEMILGILPFFVITELHATKTLLGLMEGAAESLNYILRVFSGIISDKIARRKPLILAGYAVSNFSKPLLSFASTWGDAVTVRLLDRAGKGVRTSPRDALISDSVKDAQTGKAFGLHRSVDQIGAIVGPSLAFMLLPFAGTRGLFLLSLIPGTLALVVLVLLVRDKAGVKQPTSILRNMGAVLQRKLVLFLAVIGVFTVGAYNFSFILVKAGTLGVDSNSIPLVHATLNVATVLAGLPSGIVADKYRQGKLLMAAFTFFIIATVANIFITTGITFAYLIAFIFGLYLGTSDTVQRAFIASLAPTGLKGTAYGVYYLLVGICSLAANLTVGALWDYVSMSSAFSYSLTTSVAALVALGALLHVVR